MAKRAKAPIEIEEDQGPSPHRTYRLAGQDAALAEASRAIRQGRVPNGWLITGPPGIGKATLAFRIARYLLAHGATDKGPADLSVPPNDPVSLQVAASAHPGLLVLRKGINPDTGKPMSVLSVREVRKLTGFFGMTSGAGGWRVAIVDTADDMNDEAANALLKLLEEPPARAAVLVLSNAPGRLLPTIRSRCRALPLRPLEPDMLSRELSALLPDLKDDELKSLAALSGGSPGQALRLADEDGLALSREAEKLIDGARSPDYAAILSLADKLGRRGDVLADFGDFLLQGLTDRIRGKAKRGGEGLDRWLKAAEDLSRHFERSTALYLDPRQTMIRAGRLLGQAGRSGTL
jgi:DNA polymerase-3 subunit delta'